MKQGWNRTAGLVVFFAVVGAVFGSNGAEQQDPIAARDYTPALGHELPHAIYVSRLAGVDHATTVKAELLAMSSWSPDSSTPPPVPIEAAVRLARETLVKQVTTPAEWALEHVALERVNKYWLYVVRWRPKAGGSTDRLQVPVLLSGQAVPLDPIKQQTGVQQ